MPRIVPTLALACSHSGSESAFEGPKRIGLTLFHPFRIGQFEIQQPNERFLLNDKARLNELNTVK